MTPRILLLEDDPAIAGTVAFAFEREGWRVEQVLLVREAERSVRTAPPALAVLDVGLPDGNGLSLCRQWRADGDVRLRTLPVLMLTAQGEEIDRVLGLEAGADDYLAKPFSPRELVARVRALLRRSAWSPSAADVPLIDVDEAGQRALLAGQPLDLTRLELRLLQALWRAAGRIKSREALLAEVWGPDCEANDRTVDTHVKTLRAKLREQRPDLDPIVTHRGLGYALVLPPATASR
ncbi:MAG TPA: winged helix-turn-helix domain-containing protein [Ideonella sp.]|uniref:winged helix-turn-helix domain-containing protein n=1 Tax=Ideonella sp. TaxID=1929293 RepID=UPI002E36DDD4|nr:winged helix-turn-helix domain-containing protein [Ideonella sp.]HEX5682947.1 winged helix-turn-helix domain-containing protein [Ideonella sp.]